MINARDILELVDEKENAVDRDDISKEVMKAYSLGREGVEKSDGKDSGNIEKKNSKEDSEEDQGKR